MYGQTDNSGTIFLITILVMLLAYSVGLSLLFKKVGRAPWKAFVPVLHIWESLSIVGRPSKQIFLFFIPIINVFAIIGLHIDLYKSFGKTKFIDFAFGILFPYLYLPYIGFSKEVDFVGQGATFPKKKKTQTEEWRDAVLFAVLAATLIRWMIMEAYTIPTPSMEKSLLVGDYLFVSKLHYGPRTPKTPLQLPLTHQTVWGTKIPSYLDWLQLPSWRLPGFQNVERNDVVVFNWPADKNFPTDLKTNYIKRCVAISGDTLKIKNRQVYVNGKAIDNPGEMEFGYLIYTKEPISFRQFQRYGIASYDIQNPEGQLAWFDSSRAGYQVTLPKSVAEQMKKDNLITGYDIIDNNDPRYMPALFPLTKSTQGWTIDDFGSIWVPKQGAKIEMNPTNVYYYLSTIQDYEGWDKVEEKDGKLYINNQEVKEYTFQQNYYFMMGDNRHNSLDSRFWGFVPEDHIVGKALFIFMSIDPDKSFSKMVRWERIFNGVK